MLPKAKIIYHPRFMKTLVRFDPDRICTGGFIPPVKQLFYFGLEPPTSSSQHLADRAATLPTLCFIPGQFLSLVN